MVQERDVRSGSAGTRSAFTHSPAPLFRPRRSFTPHRFSVSLRAAVAGRRLRMTDARLSLPRRRRIRLGSTLNREDVALWELSGMRVITVEQSQLSGGGSALFTWIGATIAAAGMLAMSNAVAYKVATSTQAINSEPTTPERTSRRLKRRLLQQLPTCAFYCSWSK